MKVISLSLVILSVMATRMRTVPSAVRPLAEAARCRIVPRETPTYCTSTRQRAVKAQDQVNLNVTAEMDKPVPVRKFNLEHSLETENGKNLMQLVVEGLHVDPEVESESESSEEDAIDTVLKSQVANGKSLGQRGKRRLQKALQFMEKWAPNVQQTGTNVPSYLELASLTPESLAQYLRSLGLLSALSDCSEMPIAKVDDLMCRFMNQHFLVGRKPWKGEKAMASLLCFQPAVARHSSELVRSWRALKGWKKLSPSFSRHPKVGAIWCGIAVRLIRHGKWRLAVTTLVAVAAYLQIKGRMRIRCGDFLPPTSQGANHWCLSLHPQGREEVSKTGLMDENVTFSTPLGLWMAPLFQHFHQLPKEQMLLQGTYAEHLADFKLATSQLGVPDVQLSETRHSGASIDVAKKHRNIDAVAKQGRWLSVKSLRRYERAGELNRSWNKLSAAQRIYFEKCEEEIAAAVLYGRLPPDLVTNFAQVSGSLRRRGNCDAQGGTASVRSKRVAPTSNSTVAQKRGVASAIRRG